MSFDSTYRQRFPLGAGLILLMLLMYGCSKDKPISLSVKEIGLPTHHSIGGVFFISPDVAYAATGQRGSTGSVFKTADGGDSWEEVYTIADNKLYDVFFLDEQRGYACGENMLVIETLNGGESWQRRYLPGQLVEDKQWRILRKIYFFNDSTGYTVGGQNFKGGIVAKTRDCGRNWDYTLLDGEIRGSFFHNEADIIVGAYGSVYYSNDGGSYYHNPDLKNDFFVAIDFIDNNDGLMAGYDGGIYQTCDGGKTWTLRRATNKLLKKRVHFNDIRYVSKSKVYIAGNEGLLMVSDDGGEHWQLIEGFTTLNLHRIFIGDDGSLYLPSDEGRIFTFTP